MKIFSFSCIVLSAIVLTACNSNSKVEDLTNDRYIVQNSRTGKLGVQYQTAYMKDNHMDPFEILPIKFDKIVNKEGFYFVSWDDSLAVYSAPVGSSDVSVKACKIADIQSYDLANVGTYGVPVVLTDGTYAHLFAQKQMQPDVYVSNEDVLIKVQPQYGSLDYLIAGPYDKLYDGFENVFVGLGYTAPGPKYYVVERDGKRSIGNSHNCTIKHKPIVTQWHDDVIIVRDPKNFVYLCFKDDGRWTVWLYEVDIQSRESMRCVDQLTDEQLFERLAKAETKPSEKVYLFENLFPFNRMNGGFW